MAVRHYRDLIAFVSVFWTDAGIDILYAKGHVKPVQLKPARFAACPQRVAQVPTAALENVTGTVQVLISGRGEDSASQVQGPIANSERQEHDGAGQDPQYAA